jgi:hypothetical protein
MVKEKKATSEPATKKEIKKKIATIKKSIEAAAGVNAKK